MIEWVVMAALALAEPAAGSKEDQMLQAVRAGDLAAVKALLDQGVPVDVKFRYDRTPLSFAADRGHLEIVKLLLERGADVNAKDSFYKMTPLSAAAMKGNADIVKLMLARNPSAAGEVLLSAVYGKKPALVDAALETGKLTPYDLSYALEATEGEAAEVAARLRQAGAVAPPKADFKVDAATLARYAGRYRNDKGDDEFTLSASEGDLQATFGGRTFKLAAYDARRFKHTQAVGVTLEMEVDGERVVGAKVREIGSEDHFKRIEDPKP
ncbi:MAG TPA: ankyrin repeat domain-containing protein [Vicinamibacteria bacterium]